MPRRKTLCSQYTAAPEQTRELGKTGRPPREARASPLPRESLCAQKPAAPCVRRCAGSGWNSGLLSTRPGPFQQWVPGPLGDEGTGQPAGTWLGCLRNRTPGWGQSATHGRAGDELTALNSMLKSLAELKYKRAVSESGTRLRLRASGCVSWFPSTLKALQTQPWSTMSFCTCPSPLATSLALHWTMCWRLR